MRFGVYPYPSRRNMVYGYDGMVATSNSLAAAAGMNALREGGNAVDAAIAMAYALTVVEPTNNGLGGDLFAIVYFDGDYHGLSSHGPSPASMSMSNLQQRGDNDIPMLGVASVNVPGQIAGLNALWKRFSALAYPDLVKHALHYARNGFAVSENVCDLFNRSLAKYVEALPQFPEIESWFDTFCVDRQPLRIGDKLMLPGHARSLESLAASDGASFYDGDIADAIDTYMRDRDGFLRRTDLSAFMPEWTVPLSVDYKGHIIYEIPPSGHGISVLMALKTLSLRQYSAHHSVEAMKLSLSHTLRHLADPAFMKISTKELLQKFPETAANSILDKAMSPEQVDLSKGGTVYLAAADRQGNMVSLIQSNYHGFGSGVVIPGWGIAMNNRACNFSNNPASPNFLMPRKKPYHTIIPGFIEKPGEFRGPFGLMGALMQPQGHFQVVLSMVEDKLNPQSALDRPRWQWTNGKTILVEKGFDETLMSELKKHGHELVVYDDTDVFGRGQIILRREDGLLMGACDPRSDSIVIPW